MKITERFKELLIDLLVKAYQIMFTVLIIGPYVAGNFHWLTFIIGTAACLICVVFSIIISLTIKKEGEK